MKGKWECMKTRARVSEREKEVHEDERWSGWVGEQRKGMRTRGRVSGWVKGVNEEEWRSG